MEQYINVSFDLEKLGDEGLAALFEIEKKFLEIGVSFDTGAGFGRRDWEWDFSLKGPVQIRILEKEAELVEKKDSDH